MVQPRLVTTSELRPPQNKVLNFSQQFRQLHLNNVTIKSILQNMHNTHMADLNSGDVCSLLSGHDQLCYYIPEKSPSALPLGRPCKKP